MDITSLSQIALNVILNGYMAGSGKILDSVLSKTGEELFSFIKERFNSPAQKQALDNLVGAPGDTSSKTCFLQQLQNALREDPNFAHDLKSMLPPSVVQEVGCIQGQNVIVQANNSNVHIRN
jgi:hypothetical protein